MASNFEFQSKFIKSQQFYEAGVSLIEAGYFRQATVMFWIAARDRMFGWLEKRSISYNDTISALTLVMSNVGSDDARAAVVDLYTLGVMAEWDETIFVSESNATRYKKTTEDLIAILN